MDDMNNDQGGFTTDAPDTQEQPTQSTQSQSVQPQPVQADQGQVSQVSQPNQPQAQQPQLQQTVQPKPTDNQPTSVIHPSVWRSIGETMSGLPRSRPYIDKGSGSKVNIEEGQKYKDSSTGEVISGPRRPTVGDITMGILASALEGAFAGMQQRGQGANIRAAAAGAQATMQRGQQQTQTQNEEASQEYSRRFAISEANLRMLNNAIQVGRLDREDHQSMVDSYKDQLDEYKDNSPEVVTANGVSEDEAKNLNKYPFTDYIRIPDGVVPRIDPQTGQQVTINGVKQWDNTYSIIDKNAKTNLTDADGAVKPWVKSAVDWGLKGYSPSLLNSKISPTMAVSAATAGIAQHKVAMLDTTQSELNKFTSSLKIDPIDLKTAIKSDPTLVDALQHFQRAAGQSTQPDIQIDAMRQDPKNAVYAAKIQRLFGNDNLEKYKQQREATAKTTVQEQERNAKLMNPSNPDEAQATIGKFGDNPSDSAQAAAVKQAKGLLHQSVATSAERTAAEERARQEVDRAYQQEQQNLSKTPDNWESTPNLTNLKESELRQKLQQAGVNIPANFSSLYAVGHYGEELNKVFPTRVSKGTGQLDADHALNYIKQFINPDWNGSMFGAAKNMEKQLADPKSSPVILSGTASQHLNLLKQAADALQNHDVQAMNRIGNALGMQLGNATVAEFRAINERVNNEVAKAVAGGSVAHEAEINANRTLLNDNQSPEQIDRVIRAYVGLMGGRLNEIDDAHRHYFGTPIHVSPTTTTLFKQYGVPTPWEQRELNQNKSGGQTLKNGPRQGEIPVKDKQGNIIGYTMPGKTGYRRIQ